MNNAERYPFIYADTALGEARTPNNRALRPTFGLPFSSAIPR